MQKLLAALDRLMTWGRRHGLVPGAQLIGVPLDDLEITPMKNFQFDWCLVIPSNKHSKDEVSVRVIPANRYAVIHCRGDIHKEDRAWKYLFHTWLPASGYQPTEDPTMEVYRRSQLEIGWEAFEIDCCLAVVPLERTCAVTVRI